MADAARPRQLVESPAFREASLRSEIRRVIAVIGISVLVFALVLLVGQSQQLDVRLRAAALVGMGLLLAIQIILLALVRRARRRQRMIPLGFIIVTVVVESLIPTMILLADIRTGALPAYAALGSPPVLAYGILISLMTLRLRPMLCVLAGVICAGGYAYVLLHVKTRMPMPAPSTGLPWIGYVNMTVLIFIGGLAAAWVAREIRSHAQAALGEAETRRLMDRMAQDLSVAQSIQQALLPRSAPSIPGFEIAGWNRPADQTGGDYYDWQQLPDGNWIITLADVSGHGIGPALVTTACRAYVRAVGGSSGDLPSLAARINHLLANDLHDGRFVTMVSVLIRPGGGPLALLSAGHAPIVLYHHAVNDATDIMPQDLPLAIDANMTFGPAEPIDMSPGDILALVTDGFSEWARHDAEGNRQEYGTQRLRQALRRHARLPAADVIKGITADVMAFVGDTPQQDDLTMVIIRRTA